MTFVFHNIIIEFPSKTDYIMTITHSLDNGYEHVTLVPSHKQTASHLFRWFRNMQSSCQAENAYGKISAMIEVFKTCKDKLFVSLREYILVEGIVYTCYLLQLKDDELIRKVLDLMYNFWSSFGPLHFKAVLGSRSTQKFKGLLSFYLEHARRNKLEYNGIRMIDVSLYSCIKKAPVFQALECWRWKHMLIYLQYGARCEDVTQDRTRSCFGISSALTEALRSLLKHVWFRLVSPGNSLKSKDSDSIPEYCADLKPELKKICFTFNILLRAIRRIQFGSLDFIIKDNDHRLAILMVPSRDIMNHEIVKKLIPKLSARYECPEELKHGCRWIIRKRLNENWQLPHGIRNLQVPRKLQRYLNLLED